MTRRLFGLALLGLLLVGLQPPPLAQSEPDDLTIGPTELGLAFVNSAEEPRSATRIQRGLDAGAKLDRFPLYWDRIEPVAGQWNWSGQDTAIRSNEQQGLGTLAILLGTSPAYWPANLEPPDPATMPRVGEQPLPLAMAAGAAGDADEAAGCTVAGTPPPRGLWEPIFADGTDQPAPGKAINPANPWARFVATVVQRYRPGGAAGTHVRYWEIWNEADLCHFWGGTSGEYARLLKVAYLAIESVDPQATVLWGGLALYGPKYEGGAHFLNEFVAALRNDPMAAQYNGFFDAAAIHQYSNVTHGYHHSRRVQVALAGTGWESKPIWVTESGVPICGAYPGPACPSPYRATPEEQAAYVWQNIFYTRLAGNVGPIFHFQLHDDGGNECRQTPPADGFGLVTNEPDARCVPHTAQPRLSYRAYQLAAQYLTGVDLLWQNIQDGVARRVAFYDPETKERRTLVWAIGGSDAVARVPAAGVSARRIALDGSESVITPVDGFYQIAVPRATNQNQPNSSTYTIGGQPYLLVERDTLPPTGSIEELSPVSPEQFEVSWAAEDWGSGILADSTAVWVRADEGAWTPWLVNQPASGSATFQGTPGVRYQFGVGATDRAGNVENTPEPLAETLVNDGTLVARVRGQVRTIHGSPAPWALVQVGNGTFADAQGRFDFLAPMGRWNVAVDGQVQRHGQLLLEDLTLSLVLPPRNNPIVNGDFEADGLAGWTPGGSSPMVREQHPDTRDHALRLASSFVPSPGVPGTDGSAGGNSTVSQLVTVPATAPYLSLRYQVESAESDGGNGSCDDPTVLHDKFEVIVVRGLDADYVHCQETASGWQRLTLDLSAHAGQTVTLIFNVYESSPLRRTSALLDGVTLGDSPVLSLPTPSFLPVFAR